MISYEKNTKSPIYCHPCGSCATCLSGSDIEKDSIKPEITISGTIAYDGTQSDEELLKNVVAMITKMEMSLIHWWSNP